MQFDLHTHVLPGMDDGSPNMEISLEMLRRAVADGTTHLVVTPHGNSTDLVRQLVLRDQALLIIREEIRRLQLPIQLIPGMEVRIGEKIWDLLEANPGALYNAPSCREEVSETTPLLGEIPWTMDLSMTADLFFQAQLHGYTLVLAHPERYFNFPQYLDLLMKLSDQGMYLQFNATSFWGWANFFHRRRLLKLVRHNPEQILLASDTHNLGNRPPVISRIRPFLEKNLGPEIWSQIVEKNPCRLLGIPMQQ